MQLDCISQGFETATSKAIKSIEREKKEFSQYLKIVEFIFREILVPEKLHENVKITNNGVFRIEITLDDAFKINKILLHIQGDIVTMINDDFYDKKFSISHGLYPLKVNILEHINHFKVVGVE
jgi:hypothetical protein